MFTIVTYPVLSFPAFFQVWLLHIITSLRQLFYNFPFSNMPHAYTLTFFPLPLSDYYWASYFTEKIEDNRSKLSSLCYLPICPHLNP